VERGLAVCVAMLASAAAGGCAEARDPAAAPPPARELDLRPRDGVVGDGPREGLPGTPAGARIVSLPRFGTLAWRCDPTRRPVRYAAALRLPRNSATVTGSVRTAGSARTPFTLQPGDAVSTPLTADRIIRWRLGSHHKPAPRALRVELRMGHAVQTGECVLLAASVRRTEPRRR
jgi:hypothetical protein